MEPVGIKLPAFSFARWERSTGGIRRDMEVIDLHVHILPGLDDVAADLEEALAMPERYVCPFL